MEELFGKRTIGHFIVSKQRTQLRVDAVQLDKELNKHDDKSPDCGDPLDEREEVHDYA